MIAFTYGILPTKRLFDQAWDQLILDGTFHVRASRSDQPVFERVGFGMVHGERNFSRAEVWSLLQRLTARYDSGDDQAGDVASSILHVLGFEWV